ncbi:hypothetical protein B9Z19DRAFT_1071598 [Tuber borchii]|uniref:Uncharacterized protein n=1 Tax=Tuber borchii TaxID=42251 RepID=A0A2T7A7Q1_TUBBO|nr:hypothetical protein B9Z19DRAFT_1071598 [Tuber borchii]
MRADLTKRQRAYQNLVKKVDTRNEKYEEEIRSMVFTEEQIACRKEAMNKLLAALYNELCCFRETVQKIDEEVSKLEGAAILLALKEAV